MNLEEEKEVDPRVWAKCAGVIPKIPPENSIVYYFPQGHAEHALEEVDFTGFPVVPPMVLCKVSSVKYLADAETDEVYAKIGLIRFGGDEVDSSVDCGNSEKKNTTAISMVLFESDFDAEVGGLFISDKCANLIFPELDTTLEAPVQTIVAKDIHGVAWNFQHIYKEHQHLLTTGWNTFVKEKRLIAGDTLVFVKMENGEVCVGIRRYKNVMSFVNFSEYEGMCLDMDGEWENTEMRGHAGRSAESILESVRLAVEGKPFEIVYFPRAGTPDFVVSAAMVRTSLSVEWCSGVIIYMAFETGKYPVARHYRGAVSSKLVVHDPIHWPHSPWRSLAVTWDVAALLEDVKRVNPWEVIVD